MSRLARCAWAFATLALFGAPTATRAGIDVEPDALQHYSFCISQAKDRNYVSVLDHQLLYRCHEDIAVSYFNYLGRRHVPDRLVEELGGTFIYRRIDSIGRCWHKISDEYGEPVSFYGCDVYIDL